MHTESSSQPAATEYVAIQTQTIFGGAVTSASIASLQREVTLQAQGEAVEFFDGMESFVAALSFATVYDIASEVVFRLSSGQLVLLFDHQSKETLRPKEVDETIWVAILKIKESGVIVRDILTPQQEVTIDLTALWNSIDETEDIIISTKLFIKALFEVLKPAMTVYLRGEIPNLPFVSAIYITRPYGYTIIFEDARAGSIVLFSNI